MSEGVRGLFGSMIKFSQMSTLGAEPRLFVGGTTETFANAAVEYQARKFCVFRAWWMRHRTGVRGAGRLLL